MSRSLKYDSLFFFDTNTTDHVETPIVRWGLDSETKKFHAYTAILFDMDFGGDNYDKTYQLALKVLF